MQSRTHQPNFVLFSILLLFALLFAPQSAAQPKQFSFFEQNSEQALPQTVEALVGSGQCDQAYFQRVDLTGAIACADTEPRWTVFADETGNLEPAELPELPNSSKRDEAVFVGSKLIVATERALFAVDTINLAKGWQQIYAFPGDFQRSGPIVEQGGKVFVFSTAQSLVFDTRLGVAKPIAGSPSLSDDAYGFSSGENHLFVAVPDGTSVSLLGYHTVTDQWFEGQELSAPANLVGVAASGTDFVFVGEEGIVPGATVMRPLPFGALDTLAVLAVIVALLAIGVIQSRQSSSSKDYFRAGRTIPWWAAALSIFATMASAISMMSMPAMAFSGDWLYFSIGLYSIMIMVPLFIFVFVPVIRRLNMPTANAYLEQRFGLSVRLLGFVSFSLNQVLGRVAAILLLPAIAINSIFGIPMPLSILLTGICTTAFVTFGGLRAVIWTDVLLAIVMIFAVVITLGFLLFMIDFSPTESWALLQDKDKFRMFDFRFDLAAPVTLVLVLNTIATSLGFISDQNFVQRVQSTTSERTAKRASISQLFVAVPLNVLLFGIGSLLFLYFATRPELISPAMKMDGILPYFAAISLPPGLGGFVVAALLAATVSTISSALNSVSNLGVEDIYKRFNSDASEAQSMRLARVLTVVLGIVGTGLALMLASMSGMQSIWNLFLMVTGLIIGPVTGVYILGIFTKRANSLGVWIGCVSAVALNAYATFFMNLHATVFIVIGLSATVIVGYLASYLSGEASTKSEGLTIFTLPEAERSVEPSAT
ncbi:MAG: sodium:solute symporter family transporter [Henriciella sp.]